MAMQCLLLANLGHSGTSGAMFRDPLEEEPPRSALMTATQDGWALGKSYAVRTQVKEFVEWTYPVLNG